MEVYQDIPTGNLPSQTRTIGHSLSHVKNRVSFRVFPPRFWRELSIMRCAPAWIRQRGLYLARHHRAPPEKGPMRQHAVQYVETGDSTIWSGIVRHEGV